MSDPVDLSSLYEVQREIGDIFTKMKREGNEELSAYEEANAHIARSADMVSKLNDFVEKYGADTLEESDALAKAVVAEADYINTLKGKIEQVEIEANSIDAAYSHIDILSSSSALADTSEDINSEIECKTAAMKFLLEKYPSPEYFVEDITTENSVFVRHDNGSMAARWNATFLVQQSQSSHAGAGDGDSYAHKSFLYLIRMDPDGMKSAGVQEHLNLVESQVKASCEVMASEDPIAGLPLVPFTKRIGVIGARELGVLLATGRTSHSYTTNAGSGLGRASRTDISTQAIAKRVRVMVVADESAKTYKNDAEAIKKRNMFVMRKCVTVVAGEVGEADDIEEVSFQVVPPK